MLKKKLKTKTKTKPPSASGLHASSAVTKKCWKMTVF